MAPPNKAGILANLSSSLGRIRTKDAFRTTTALEKAVLPAGHVCLRAALIAECVWSRPPAEDAV